MDPTRHQTTLTLRILRELGERGPGATVMVHELAQKLGQYTPPDKSAGTPAIGDAHPTRQVLNRLSRASFADDLGFGPLERWDKQGPFTVYRVTEGVYEYIRQRDPGYELDDEAPGRPPSGM